MSRDVSFPIEESERLYRRTLGLIPASTQTLAKGPAQHVRGVAPIFLRRGQGCRVEDVDGNAFVDWSMGIGPLVLGYAHPAVDEAIRRQLADGITFSLPHPLEVEVAEAIHEVVPNAESVRFSKTGADVTSAAVRLARAATGRRKVLCCGYHGWHDWYVATTDRRRGVPTEVADLTFTVDHGDLGQVEAALDDDTACVILEPTVFDPPPAGYLEGLRRLCDRAGALLVFDEMWTGFRIALGGAQERFGVRPDLATFSKAVANGMPLSVLTGRREVMSLLEKEVFFFTTFGGEALSLAAAKATMEVLREEDVPARLEETGRRLVRSLKSLVSDAGLAGTVRVSGLPARTLVSFDPSAGSPLEMRSFVQQELLCRGHLWNGVHNLALAHGDAEVVSLLDAFAETLPLLSSALSAGDLRRRILGEVVEPLFRRVSSFNTRPAAVPAAKGGW